MIAKNLLLTCKRVEFFSIHDEAALFEWIKKIRSIEEISADGDELYLHIKSKNISRNDLLELIGLFSRYKINMKQLAIFLNKKNENWFYSDTSYWYKNIFGPK